MKPSESVPHNTERKSALADTHPGRLITGGCHCGNIAYRLLWPEKKPGIQVRACGCTFCRKHGGAYTSHPEARLEIRFADASRVEHYRFGTKTAEFLVCRTCGVVPIVTSMIEGALHAVVSVRSFDDVDPSEFEIAETDFDGETTEDRLARRQRNWISNVLIA